MKTIIGVMGGSRATPAIMDMACEVGRLIAQKGWVLLNGGRAAGVMEASAKGAHEAGGLVLGILPDRHTDKMSAHVDIPVLTGMGSTRNALNALSSMVVVALPGAAGTLSEIALALAYYRPVVLLGWMKTEIFEPYRKQGRLVYARSPAHAIELAQEFMQKPPGKRIMAADTQEKLPL